MWQTYLRPTSLDDALDLLREHAGHARLIAGGTDVLVELPRGILPTDTLIDLTAIGDLKYVREEGDHIALGALATHNDVIASPACVARVRIAAMVSTWLGLSFFVTLRFASFVSSALRSQMSVPEDTTSMG